MTHDEKVQTVAGLLLAWGGTPEKLAEQIITVLDPLYATVIADTAVTELDSIHTNTDARIAATLQGSGIGMITPGPPDSAPPTQVYGPRCSALRNPHLSHLGRSTCSAASHD